MDIAGMRKEYLLRGLSEDELAADPLAQFGRWFDEACGAGLIEPHAMTLATAAADGRPSARTVLLRGYDERGFVFYTNYESRKGRELAANPWAALLFFWPELERQIRIEGRVAQVAPAESDAYFASRPEGSRLGAWASPQSEVIAGREALEELVRAVAGRFAGVAPPRPPHWGGYRLRPDSLEFWQGRLNRLHDRLRYRRLDHGGWVVERLAP